MNVRDMTEERKSEEIQRKVVKRIKSRSYEISQMRLLDIPWKNLKTNLPSNRQRDSFEVTSFKNVTSSLTHSPDICLLGHPSCVITLNRQEEEFSSPIGGGSGCPSFFWGSSS